MTSLVIVAACTAGANSIVAQVLAYLVARNAQRALATTSTTKV